MLWSLLLTSLTSLIGSAYLNQQATALCSTINMIQTRNITNQSSTYSDNISYTSDRATDGENQTCAITTDSQRNPWWKIDLLGVYKISHITIYNADEKHTDISGAKIHIGNSPENSSSRMFNVTNFKKDKVYSYKINMTGRYVTITLPRKGPLILCDVKIFGTGQTSPFILITEKKTWSDALYYCRENHTDLASILDEETQTWAELEAKKADTPFVWLGLHYTCTLDFWFWVQDHVVAFHRWDSHRGTEDCNMSGAMMKTENHSWFIKCVDDQFNFICAK